jgi:glycosyltransferase involved in cell wall biosynthesis
MNKQPTAVICLSRVNGGMELAAVKLARLLSKKMPVHFIARESGFIERHRKEHFEGHDIILHTIGFSSNFGWSLINKSRNIFKKEGIKNVIFLGASEMKSLYFACLGLDINFVIRQGSKKSTPKKDRFHTLVYSDVDTFVGNCDFIVENIKEIIPLNKKTELKRIYASLALRDIERTPRETKRLELISVGRINPVKGQLHSVKACGKLHDAGINFRLRLLGDRQDEAYYNEITVFLGTCPYKEKIEFTGYTPDVPSYLAASDIFLFPTQGEGMSNAVIEALGYGLVPIIYDNSSSPEFISLGFHLHLVEDGNLEAFSEALLKTAKNFAEEKSEIKKNMELAREVFAPSREQREYLALLK